jgi:hypothetical protein
MTAVSDGSPHGPVRTAFAATCPGVSLAVNPNIRRRAGVRPHQCSSASPDSRGDELAHQTAAISESHENEKSLEKNEKILDPFRWLG